MTREQAAVMLTVVYQYRNEDNRKAFLLWVALYGRDNDLNDDSNLTEQQASNMLAGIYHKLDTVISSVGAKEFADDGEISDWAKNSVYFMEKNGIITGVGGDRFDPQADIQAQAALVMSVQMLQKLGVSGTPRKGSKREALSASLLLPAGQWSGGPAKRFTGPGTGSHASRRRIPPGPDRGQTAAPPSGNRPLKVLGSIDLDVDLVSVQGIFIIKGVVYIGAAAIGQGDGGGAEERCLAGFVCQLDVSDASSKTAHSTSHS